MKKYSFNLIAFMFFGCSLLAQSETTVTGSSSFVNIPDNDSDGATAQITFNNIPSNAVLTNIEVTLAINHNNVGDLRIALISPGGQELVLMNRPERNDFGDFENANLISTHPISFSDDFTSNPELMGTAPAVDTNGEICKDDNNCEFLPFDDSVNPKNFAYLVNATNANGGPRGTWKVNISDLSSSTIGNFQVAALSLTYTMDFIRASNSYSTNGLTTILDNNTSGTSILLNASDFPTLGTLNWIEVSLAINHDEAGDLKMVLKAPTGDEIVLVNRPARVFGVNDFTFVEGNLSDEFPINFKDDAMYNGKSLGGGFPEPPLVPFDGTICADNNICDFYPGDDVNNTKQLSDLVTEVNNNGGAAGNWTVTISDLASGVIGRYRVNSLDLHYIKCIDNDNDGVCDTEDQELNSPCPDDVDANGVSNDEDGDGFINCQDAEPNSPCPDNVDANGVSNEDDDNDGIVNCIDDCDGNLDVDNSGTPDCQEALVMYVNADAALNGDGTSWLTAFKYLQDALNTANNTTDNIYGRIEIWVAKGVYFPDEDEAGNVTNDNNLETFQLQNKLSILGGFNGTETSLDTRDPMTNLTLLSGDIDGDDTEFVPDGILSNTNHITGNNAIHIVTGSNTDSTAILDGFTITAGDPREAFFPHNYGGGLFNFEGSPTLMNLSFIRNTADAGGGLANFSSNPTLINVRFLGNTAIDGGGMYNSESAPTITNVTFSGNDVSSDGGALYNFESSPILTNVSFTSNTATRAGAMYNRSGNPFIRNTIFSGNSTGSSTNAASNTILVQNGTPSISYSYFDAANLPAGVTDGGNNLFSQEDPFLNVIGLDQVLGTEDDNLQLTHHSTAIDAGNNSFNSTTEDMAGNARFFDDSAVIDMGSGAAPIIDMGAFEKQSASKFVLFVDADAFSDMSSPGISWARAYKYLQDALAVATAGDEIWVAEGVYYPDEDEAGNVTNNDENATFQLINNVTILGGFQGTEITSDERNIAAYVTILSGDIDQNDTDTNSDNIANQTTDIVGNNSFHVVNGSNTNNTAILDGCTITAGQADGSGFNDNNGAGVFNNFGEPSLQNLNLIGNIANNGGGGMFNGFLSPLLTNLSFSKNVAKEGGGMANISSSVVLTNISFSLNEAEDGGAIYNFAASPTISNTIFYGNTASNSGSSIQTNGVSSPTVSYSYFDDVNLPVGMTDGGNNLLNQANPFLDADQQDLRLLAFSNAIDAGDNTSNTVAIDLAGNPRKFDDAAVNDTGNGTAPVIDIGAFEKQTLSSSVIFVDADANLGGDGASWNSAYKYLQDALNLANNHSIFEEIWVADGVYYPDEDEGGNIAENDQRASFQLINNISLLGGFNGTESTSNERNPETNISLLSGDIDGNDTTTGNIVTNTDNLNGNNSYQVVVSRDNDNTALFEGFTITAGFATDRVKGGGGMYVDRGNPMLTQLKFIGNYSNYDGGSGLYNDSANPTITNVIFMNNGGASGAGMFNAISNPILNNVSFLNNNTFAGGGGMYNTSSNPVLINVVFSGNSADEGGALNNVGSEPTLINVTFLNNTGIDEGGAIYNQHQGISNIRNCIFYGNVGGDGNVITSTFGSAKISYSYFDDASLSTGNIDEGNNLFGQADPFVDAANGDLQLVDHSSAIDAGDNNQNSTTKDLAGNARNYDDSNVADTGTGIAPIIDMGAFEKQSDSKLIPDVIAPIDMTYCNGIATSAISFSGTVTGTLFSWSNSNTDIGLAANGTGNIAAFTATNTTSSAISAAITVMPYTVGLNGVDDGGTGDDCLGTAQSFTITVFNNTACATSCTTNDLTIDENSTEEGIIQAIETITSNRIIADNTEVIFKAGTSITLQAGFHAVAGSSFTAQIEACPATLIASEARSRTATNTNTLTQPKVKVFPNPVRAYTNISINLPEEQTVQLDIFDLNGRKIATIVPPTPLFAGIHTFEWACDQVDAGIYFVVMNGRQVGRLAVMR